MLHALWLVSGEHCHGVDAVRWQVVVEQHREVVPEAGVGEGAVRVEEHLMARVAQDQRDGQALHAAPRQRVGGTRRAVVHQQAVGPKKHNTLSLLRGWTFILILYHYIQNNQNNFFRDNKGLTHMDFFET